MQRAMQAWAAQSGEVVPPAEIGTAVLDEFDRVWKAKRRVQWSLATLAAAASIAVIVWVPKATQSATEPVAVTEDTPFTSLPFVVQPAQYERTEVRRMSLPLAELIAVGFPVRGDPAQRVEADVLVGQDGRARAVRLVWKFE